MFQSGKTAFIPKKAFEIAYAIFRVSANQTDQAFADMLRGEATSLLGNAAKGDYAEAAKSIAAIEYFIKLAAEANFISFTNTEIIFKELGNLNAAIAGSSNPAIQDVDLSGIFSDSRPQGEQALFQARKKEAKQEREERPEEGISLNAEIRQTTILERIRQSGNCRLKDILELFPDASERTLRYDLQSLIEQDLVERIGNGGPSVSYRAKAQVA